MYIPKTLVTAVLNVSFTGCDNEQHSLAKLSYSAIDNVLSNLLPAGLQDFRHRRIESDDDGK